ncbi:Adenylosuccinate synthetase [Xylaria bambusicola]|uniref:Adenylosuccinate synthetase n=1 Tax=Xylaria bambusicola TaxID=326684 RepID=UPI002007CF57|nr:Adenylosuccinate synthetase [Xylaria bambusicola]KAI0509281.1 Adenylosuccinate synthetase [Xylaria bambusicola]
MATIILGAQWGNEGKHKLAEKLVNEGRFQLCARAAGGHDAVHSKTTDGVDLVSHLLPSGLMNPTCMNLIGSGVVLHIPTFFKELETFEARSIPSVQERILISDRCQIDLDLYAAVRALETPDSFIPWQHDSTATMRNGIRLYEIFDQEAFETKLRKLANLYGERFGHALQYDPEGEIQRFREYRPKLAGFCVDAVHLVQNMQDFNTKFLVEGHSALMFDMNYGAFPYVISSNTSLGGIFTGLAIHPKKIDQIIGVAEAYTTRLDGGIFKTEDHSDIGIDMQTIGQEWDTSTGRKRRCGWIDLVALKYSTAVNHYTCLNLSKLDILDKFPVIKLAIAYKDPETGDQIENYPADPSILERCEVVYHEMKGWQQPIKGINTFESLPQQAQAYVKFIEEHCGVSIARIGTGPN